MIKDSPDFLGKKRRDETEDIFRLIFKILELAKRILKISTSCLLISYKILRLDIFIDFSSKQRSGLPLKNFFSEFKNYSIGPNC